MFDYDYIIVGSGFGGSVSALRLSEKGYTVAILERGKRFNANDYAKSNWQIKKYLWFPLLKCFGIQNLSLFKHVLILSGSGVGGGSLVYANTLLEPKESFYESDQWKHLADWKSELRPHYATAKKMLGVTRNPYLFEPDEKLKEIAKEMNREHTFTSVDVAVYFGEKGKEGKTVTDPFFGGAGPDRAGCVLCGGCMVGCQHNAKNTLDKNYLYFAEKNGAKVLPETNVTNIVPIENGYEVHIEKSTAWFFKEKKVLRSKAVVLSAGVLGTNALLFRCRDVTKTLPNISPTLGQNVRTNSEALIGVTTREKIDLSKGIAITSGFYPDENTHVEPVRYSKGSSFMKLLAAPMVDDGNLITRPLKLILASLLHPVQALWLLFHTKWAERTIILLVMQTLDSKIRFIRGRNLFTLYRKKMTTSFEKGAKKIPSYIPIGHVVARLLAKKMNAMPQSAINEVFLQIPTTAHILGGCSIGESIETGVIDKNQKVFGYENLYVCDGSAIPANLGVNPSLTITAMTERAMSRIPNKT
ncbi:MAG: GMC oxidoreductase [Bacteriovoracia bacterium]